MSLTKIVTAINTGGVVAVLIFAIQLGLRGDVVTGDQLAKCQMERDAYLGQLYKYLIPIPQGKKPSS